jgi:hypothetical protein
MEIEGRTGSAQVGVIQSGSATALAAAACGGPLLQRVRRRKVKLAELVENTSLAPSEADRYRRERFALHEDVFESFKLFGCPRWIKGRSRHKGSTTSFLPP